MGQRADESSRSYGFGIVGTGTIAPKHAAAIRQLPNARLVAVTDVQPEVSQAFGLAHRCDVEPSLRALLSREDIDVISICVPSGLHAEVGRAAAAAGKHLIVEKPIDVSLAAADSLIESARAAGIALTVISQHRFSPGAVELRKLLDQNGLGRLVLGEACTKWYRSQEYYDSAEWRGTWALDGGSLMNQGIHYLDLLCWSMGSVAEVTAVYGTQIHEINVEDTTVAILKFRSGAIGSVVSSTAVFPGFAQRLEVSGTNGSVIIENSQPVFRQLLHENLDSNLRGSEITRFSGQPTAERSYKATGEGLSPHAAQIADLLAAVGENREPYVTAANGRATLEVVCAIYQAAQEGRAISIPEEVIEHKSLEAQ